MNTIKANFFGNDIELTLTEEEIVNIISLTEEEMWKNAVGESFLGGLKNNIVKQITIYDKLDNEYDNTLQDRDERPRQYPFDSFFDAQLSMLINNIQIAILDTLEILDEEHSKYLDLEEISELRETIEIEVEIDKDGIKNNCPELFL